MSVLCASDLDRTLIYSAAAIERWGGGGETVAVERYRDVDTSFMTAAAATVLSTLSAVLVPVTTRTTAQLARVRLPGPAPRWAVAANGGVLLQDGVPDGSWTRNVQRRLRAAAPLARVADDARAACRPEWTSAVRVAEDLFCYAVLDPASLPEDFVAAQRAQAAELGWTVSLQGRKLYWVPTALTKSAAVAEIAHRAGATSVLAAGDSLLDADLLDAADHGVLARHGELAESGWQATHVQLTERCGIAAGEEIVGWFAGMRELRPPVSTKPAMFTWSQASKWVVCGIYYNSTASSALASNQRKGAMPTSAAHAVEEFFLRDFAVFDGVEPGFIHGHAFAGHGSYFRGDLVFEPNDKAIAIRPWTLGFSAVDFVIFHPPFVLALDRINAFGFRRH